MKLIDVVCGVIGMVGSFIVSMLGGWDAGLQTLVVFMVIDFVSGMVVAGVFKKSPKTKTGALESNTGFKGVCKKCMILVFVLIGYCLDMSLGVDYIRNLVIIAFIANELISITENAGLMGLPIPPVITNAIDILKQKGDVQHDH